MRSSIASISRSVHPLLRSLGLCSSLLVVGTGSLAASARAPRPQETGIVAVLETRVPEVSEFLLRGTVPLPRSVYPRLDGGNPFTILDWDDTPLVTQVEIVSRYADEAGGADVVELLARVHSNPEKPVGATARYRVFFGHPNPPQADTLESAPRSVHALLLDPSGIEIRTYDCFGNLYVTRPLMPGQSSYLHSGPVYREARVHGIMLPEPPGPGTLPHLLGVHSYISWSAGSSGVGLDLRIHNAFDGHDTLDPRDDPLDKVYFERIEISVPQGWGLLQDFSDPLFGSTRVEGGRRIVALVRPNPDGGLHVMRWQAQFNRRLMLTPLNGPGLQEASARLEGAGRAFCARGFNAQGREYWSWWNRETARYFPQRHVLPSLEHVGMDELDGELEGELGFLAFHMASGTSAGNYPLPSRRLGWGHPYGVSYGGMTSGDGINCYDGIQVAAAASPKGYRLFTLLHRMQTDRQPNALFQINGAPSSVEEWRVEDGGDGFVPFEHFVVPLIEGSRQDPFGARQAPRFQIDYVRANGLQPDYEGAHVSYDPHDYAHFIRYTRSAKVLVWLANDSLAKDDLLTQAEAFNLSFHGHSNDPYGNPQVGGLKSLVRYVRAIPAKGIPYGRDESWGMDCAVAAYAVAGREWRANKLPWFELQAETLMQGQAACSGFIQALVSNKAVDGKYHARQQIEQSITENALVGLHETVFRHADPAHAGMVRGVLAASLRAFISPMAWFPGQPGPWRYTGVGPLDRSLPVWCSRDEMPPDAWTAGDIEGYQDWSSFAYGYELTGSEDFLTYARLQTGGSTLAELANRLKNAGTFNIENRAAILALVQRLTGEL